MNNYGNNAISSIGVDFLEDRFDYSPTNIKGFLDSVKQQNLLPFDRLSIHYHDNYWNFEGFSQANIDSNAFHYDFSSLNKCFVEDVKDYVLICLMEGRLKINIIKGYFRFLVKFLNFCAEQGALSVSDILARYVREWFEKGTESHSERYKLQRCISIRSFFIYYNACIRELFDNEYFVVLSDCINTKICLAEILNNKTPNIPEEVFNQIVSAAIQTIDDEEAPAFFRALSCMILMESQIGLRSGELFALEVGCVHPITISTGETAYFMEYKTWKRVHGSGTISKEITYVNELFMKGYDTILKISRHKREEIKMNYLFVESKSGTSTKFPVSPSKAIKLVDDIFEYYNKYFKTVYDSPQNIKGLSCSVKKKEHGTKETPRKYIVHPTITQFRVHMCSELYAKGCPIDYIEKFMSHLSSEMACYYVRPKNTIQENYASSIRILKELVTKESIPLGADKGLLEKIDEFISENKFNVEKDIDKICEKLSEHIPIRVKYGGVCIKSSRFRECSKDAMTDEFYCAYGVCPNIYTFYYMADISYRQTQELVCAIDINRKKGCIRQVQKNINMLQTILKNKLIPQINEMKRMVHEKGLDNILMKHPQIEDIVLNIDEIEREIAEWRQIVE